MKQFEYLARKRVGALSIFEKVRGQLSKLEREIKDLISYAEQNIREAEKQIAAQRDSISYLGSQLDATEKSRQHVEQFLPTPQEPSA